MAQPLTGVVKAVPSGDTVIVMGVDASRGPPPEKQITLSGLEAPRLGNRNGPTADAPWAWASREHLRQRAVGKRVTFKIEGAAPSGTREFGTVWLEDGTSLRDVQLTAGWAKLKDKRGGADDAEAAGLARAAEDQGLGVWAAASASAVRDVKWAGTFEVADVVKAKKGQPLDAVVEQVPGGTLVRVMLTPGFEQVSVMLSGVQSPTVRFVDGVEEAQPFAREARFFVESRLLNRSVQVVLQGVDKSGAAFGTVLHPAGNVGLELVKLGLARVVDWSAQLADNASELRAAERAAKEKRLRIWKDYVPPNHGSGMDEFQGRVVEVVSGDTIVVADQGGAERRLSLSSVRCPRVFGGNMVDKSEPYGMEAKEALRKALIGKRVRVVPEYKRTFGGGDQDGDAPARAAVERTFASVFYNNERNAARTLIAEGLATVARHGQADERSTMYDELCTAEEEAAKAKKGLHSSAPPPARVAPTDLSLPNAKERAKSYVGSFQRQGRLRAVVQFIFNGARFKLLVLKENVLIGFACVGVRCPQCARRGDASSTSEPYADEALAFSKGMCFQREVEVEIEGADKNGVFMGTLHLPDKRNLAVVLLEGGLARRVGAAADRSTHAFELAAAEESAQGASLKVWENYAAEKAAAEAAAAAAAAAEEEAPLDDADKQVTELNLTEIVDGAHFFAHVAGDAAVDQLQRQLATACGAASGGAMMAAAFNPTVGTVVAAKFSADDEWYRARVKGRADGKYEVFFLDYGNVDVVGKERLLPLDPTLGPAAISAQAVECRLAHLIVADPKEDANGEEAAMALSAAAWGKAARCRVEARDRGVLHVTLLDGTRSVNEEMVEQGLARVEKTANRKAAPLVAKLREKEDEAKAAHRGVWRYGDVEEDDAPEFGKPAPKPAAAPSKPAWGKK